MKLTDPPATAFDSEDATDRDAVTGQFLTGRKGVGGRKKGARARWSEQFMADIEAAWKEGGKSVIDRAMFHDPAGTLKALIGILPKHAKLEITTPIDGMTDEQLERMLEIAERFADGAVIDGTRMRNVTPTLPPPLADAPPTAAQIAAEALRRDMIDQHDALAAATPVLPSQVLPHPVGRAVPVSAREEERRNIAKLHDDVDPASLF
ncbi:hypothetical protein [uncultured Sphingomonas sp.]|uniref:hypothetical protein n=1 Tax=uncultured Sphingomonas sp. TaxID=158754 RepID=UPI0035CC8A00